MKWWIINALCWLAALPACAAPAADSLRGDTAQRRPTFYERRTKHLSCSWARMVPNMGSIHFYGGVGLVSLGTGWHYGRKDQWETEVLLGFVPKYESDHNKATLTLKQRFVPWRIGLSSRWAVGRARPAVRAASEVVDPAGSCSETARSRREIRPTTSTGASTEWTLPDRVFRPTTDSRPLDGRALTTRSGLP